MNYLVPKLKRRLRARLVDWSGGFLATLSLVFAKIVLQCCSAYDSDRHLVGQLVTRSDSYSLFGDILFLVWVGIGLVPALLYEVPLVALRGQTVGKMMTGVRVVRFVDGGVPGWWRSAVRWAVLYGPMLIPVVGWLVTVLVVAIAGRDPHRRGLHDRIAGTVVLDMRPAAGGGSR